MSWSGSGWEVFTRISSQCWSSSRLHSILGSTFFLIYINDLPDDVVCNIAIYADDTTLYSSGIRHLICGNKSMWLLNLNLMYEALWTWAGSGLLITILEKLNFLVWPVLYNWCYWCKMYAFCFWGKFIF